MNITKSVVHTNETELKRGVAGSAASWHEQYRNSAYIHVGNLDYALTEGDIYTVFEQFGTIVDLDYKRDPTTGIPKGFCFLAYEDQRSTDLAVDNFNGILLAGRTIRVTHCDNYFKLVKKDTEENVKSNSPTPSSHKVSSKRRDRSPSPRRDRSYRRRSPTDSSSSSSDSERSARRSSYYHKRDSSSRRYDDDRYDRRIKREEDSSKHRRRRRSRSRS